MSHSLPKCDYWKCPWHSSRFLQWDLLLLQRLQNICCFHLLPGTRTSQTISAVKSGNACSFWMYWKLICTIKNWTVTESNWTYKIGNLEIMFYDWYFILKMWFYCLLVCRCLLANTKLFSCRKIVTNCTGQIISEDIPHGFPHFLAQLTPASLFQMLLSREDRHPVQKSLKPESWG